MSMPISPIGQLSGPVVLTGVVPGYAVIPSPTPLTFLNYYDGKFLQASDLRQEQLATQTMIQLSNQAAGTPGPAYGFDITLGSSDILTLGPGLGTDPQGRVLYLPQSVDVPVSDLLASMQAPGGSGTGSQAASGATGNGMPGAGANAFQPCDLAASGSSATPVSGSELYLVTLSAAEGLCGTDEIFGRLCDAACVTAADRPWRIEGVLLGLVPLTLSHLATSTSVVLTQVHLRSQVASAYYAAEKAAGGSLISAAGLAATTWCLGATAVGGDAIYLGVLARSGGSTIFLDEWTARRERIEASPRRYWAGRMAMRPWNVFLAQVLHFQCQLAEVLGSGGTAGLVVNPLSQAMTLLNRSATLIDELEQGAPAAPAVPATAAPAAPAPLLASLPAGSALEQAIADYRQQVSDVLARRATASTHTLIDGGIIELPPAGYLPIDLTTAAALEAQVSLLLGQGVDLRFCVMRHDEAGSEFTKGQHLDRIPLLTGLDDPSQRQQVDILVPDGTWQTSTGTAPTQPTITPTLDWVLFRRRIDVNCSPPSQQLDTVALYADEAISEDAATTDWGNLEGQDVQWTKLGDLQFNGGTTTLVTTSATVQDWWTAAGIGTELYGAAYAPAASASDPVALGRANNLVAALSPTVSDPPNVSPAALSSSPEPLDGAVGALFVVAWPQAVVVAVWATVLSQSQADQEWDFITGVTGVQQAKPVPTWTHEGVAVLTVETPPRLVSWNGPGHMAGVAHAGYSPNALPPGAAGVQALLNQIGANASPILPVTKPPRNGNAIFLIRVH
jgi:hypothetical protein